MKIYHGTIVLRHPIDPRRMGLLREQYAEQKKGRLLYYCSLARMKNGAPILWRAVCVCDPFKISWQMGKHLMKDDAENHSKARSRRSVQGLNIIRFSAKDKSRLHQCGEKVLAGILLADAFGCGVNKGDVLVADIEDLGKVRRVRNPCSKAQCKRSMNVKTG